MDWSDAPLRWGCRVLCPTHGSVDWWVGRGRRFCSRNPWIGLIGRGVPNSYFRPRIRGLMGVVDWLGVVGFFLQSLDSCIDVPNSENFEAKLEKVECQTRKRWMPNSKKLDVKLEKLASQIRKSWMPNSKKLDPTFEKVGSQIRKSRMSHAKKLNPKFENIECQIRKSWIPNSKR